MDRRLFGIIVLGTLFGILGNFIVTTVFRMKDYQTREEISYFAIGVLCLVVVIIVGYLCLKNSK